MTSLQIIFVILGLIQMGFVVFELPMRMQQNDSWNKENTFYFFRQAAAAITAILLIVSSTAGA